MKESNHLICCRAIYPVRLPGSGSSDGARAGTQPASGDAHAQRYDRRSVGKSFAGRYALFVIALVASKLYRLRASGRQMVPELPLAGHQCPHPVQTGIAHKPTGGALPLRSATPPARPLPRSNTNPEPASIPGLSLAIQLVQRRRPDNAPPGAAVLTQNPNGVTETRDGGAARPASARAAAHHAAQVARMARSRFSVACIASFWASLRARSSCSSSVIAVNAASTASGG